MIDQLIHKIRHTKAPIVVGLDPMLSFIPKKILECAIKQHGETLAAAAAAILEFNKGILDAIADLIPAVKPQIAMYEQFGVQGMEAFYQTVQYAQKKGLLVIGDIKRGDIGSTSLAYATGHLGSVQVGNTICKAFDEDFATVNPYLGYDGVLPFLDVCQKENKGIFILVKTSNPSSGEFQDRITDGRPLYEHVAMKVNEWGERCPGSTYSNIGAVVGATYPAMGKVLREIMPKSFILVPGYGAQGATAKDLIPFFYPDGLGAIVNSSRAILTAYRSPKNGSVNEDSYADAARAAVIKMREDIGEALGFPY
ncbi:MAG: orotidine-5'-phosphate decarboxylase [Lachnospiraceae bacterium]|jgi:orotidine-5'-phosphate decarboxylase|nr:orotidine-5'-phosphate decarboxylase [Lachnospiraceae bacterium]